MKVQVVNTEAVPLNISPVPTAASQYMVVRLSNGTSYYNATGGGGGGGGTSSDFDDIFPIVGTAVGFSDGTNMVPARVFDLDSGAGTQNVLGVSLRSSNSGGSQELGTASNPIRVNPTGTTAQPVTDNGGSLTVDGTVSAAQSGSWDISSITNVVHVDDNSSSITVDNSGTFAVQVNSALPTGTNTIGSVKLTDGTDTADILDLASSNPLAVAIVDSAGDQISSFGGGTQYTEGDVDTSITGTAVLWEDTGNTLSTISSSKPLPVNIVAGASSGTEYTEDSASVANPVGGQLISRRRDNIGAETDTDGDVIALNATNRGELYVKQTDPVVVTQSGTWDIATVTAVTGITNVVHVDDNGSTLSVDDGGSTISIDDGAGSITVDGTVTIQDGGGSITVDNAGTFATQATLQTGSNQIGHLEANQSVNITQVSGLTIDLGTGTTGTGTIRVAVSSDSFPTTQAVSGTVTVTQSAGTNLHTIVDSGTISTITNVVHIDDNSGSLSVDDGGGSLTVDGSIIIASGVNQIGHLEDDQSVNITKINGTVDSGNSSTTPLGGNSTFTGTAADVLNFANIDILVFSDQNSAANGLQLQFSTDSTNWDGVLSFTLTANSATDISVPPRTRYFRIVYTNGAVAQSVFRLQTIYRAVAVPPAVVKISDTVDPNAAAALSKASIVGKTTAGGGTFVDVKVNPSGALTVDASGTAVPVTDNGSSLTVDDGGGSLTVDGTVAVTGITVPPVAIGGETSTATASGYLVLGNDGAVARVINTNSSGHISINDGGNSITVDGSLTTVSTVTSITNVVHVDDNNSTLSIDDGAGSITVDNNGTFATQATLQTGSNQIGHLEADQSVNVTQVSGLAIDVGAGTIGTGTIRVVIASDSSHPVTSPTASNFNAQVVGSVASGSTDSGNPVKVGGVYNVTAPTLSNGQRADLQVDAYGNLFTIQRGSDAVNGFSISSNGTRIVLVSNPAAVMSTLIIFLNSLGTGGQIQIQTSDGVNFYSLPAINVNTGVISSTITSLGVYQINMAGMLSVWMQAVALSSGTISGAYVTSPGVSGVTVDNPLPAGTNLIGKFSIDDGNYTANVRSLTNSSGLNVAILDSNGDQITSFGGGTQYTEDAAAAANPTGTTPILVRQDTPATLTTTDGDNVAQRATNYGAAYVQVLSSTGSFVDSFGGGTQYTEGDTDASITGTAMLMEGAANTLVVAQGNATDGLLVNLGSNNDVVISDGGNTITVDGTVAIGTGSAQIGHLEANQSVNVTQVSGLNIDLGIGTTGTGTQRVILALDSVLSSISNVVQVGDNSTTLSIDDGAGSITVDGTVNISGTVTVSGMAMGNVDHDDFDSGYPVKIGGRAITSNPTAVAHGDRVNFTADDLGRQVVIPGQIRDLIVHQHTQISNSTSETTILTQAASTFHDLVQLVITNQTATAVNVTIKDSTGGTTRMVIALAASGGAVLNFARPVPQATINGNWTATLSVNTVTVNIFAMAEKNI